MIIDARLKKTKLTVIFSLDNMSHQTNFATYTQSAIFAMQVEIVLTLPRVMVSFRTVVPFNGPFSSNLSASGFDVVNCGPSHTAICPSCN